MERLTIPDVRVDEHTTRKTIIDARAVREHAMDFYWRLKAYEDTELDPAVCADYKTFEDEAISKGVPFKRIVALMEADRAGLLVVLPCKDWLEVVFGDQVLFWGIDKDYAEQPIREISLDDADRIGWYDGYKTVFLKGTDENGEAWEFYPEEIGKTIFLTHEEAEAALEAMKDG